MLTYLAYGLRIRSEVTLPARRIASAHADVSIRLGRIEPLPPPAALGGFAFRTGSGELCFGCDGVGRFLIRKGREIVIDPDEGADAGVLRVMILGPALAALLYQRGILILHGSAVEVGGTAVAFLGSEGAGKSTTAAALHARGHGVVADDVVAIQMEGGAPHVRAAYPQLNVWPDTAASLDHDPSTMPRLHARIEKRAFAADRFPLEPLPLSRIYVLRRGASSEIERLRPQEALIELIRHSYGVRRLQKSTPTKHFKQCAGMAATVGVHSLTVRPALSELSCLASLVERDVRSSQHPS